MIAVLPFEVAGDIRGIELDGLLDVGSTWEAEGMWPG